MPCRHASHARHSEESPPGSQDSGQQSGAPFHAVLTSLCRPLTIWLRHSRAVDTPVIHCAARQRSISGERLHVDREPFIVNDLRVWHLCSHATESLYVDQDTHCAVLVFIKQVGPHLERMAPPARPLPPEALTLMAQHSQASVSPAKDIDRGGQPTVSLAAPQQHSASPMPSLGVEQHPGGDLQTPAESPSGLPGLAAAPSDNALASHAEGLSSQPSISSSLAAAELQFADAPIAEDTVQQEHPDRGLIQDLPYANDLSDSHAGAAHGQSPAAHARDVGADPLGASSHVGTRSTGASPLKQPLTAFPRQHINHPSAAAITDLSNQGLAGLADGRGIAGEAHESAEHLTAGMASMEAAEREVFGRPEEQQLLRKVSELDYFSRDPSTGFPLPRYRPTADAEHGAELVQPSSFINEDGRNRHGMEGSDTAEPAAATKDGGALHQQDADFFKGVESEFLQQEATGHPGRPDHEAMSSMQMHSQQTEGEHQPAPVREAGPASPHTNLEPP